jgi:hypothetical protein
MLLLQEEGVGSGRLHVGDIMRHVVLLENGEDESDDHGMAEMGGGPGPTGRANLFGEKNHKGSSL